ncbi:MAG: hypothetical protein ABJA82_02940 [Myxococcales bacterium]
MTSWVVPVPVASAVPKFVPSVDTNSWYPRGKLPVLVPASRVTWLNACGAPRSTWKVWPLVWLTAVLHRVAALPSRALATGSAVAVDDAVATQPARVTVGPATFISWIDQTVVLVAV